jgi:hemoglobin/transferrin/lactoferrin receptor protein
MKLRLTFFFILISLLTDIQAQTQTGKMSGLVLDSETNNSVTSLITVYNKDKAFDMFQTETDGRFKFNLPYGTYRFVIQSIDHTTFEKTINIDSPYREVVWMFPVSVINIADVNVYSFGSTRSKRDAVIPIEVVHKNKLVEKVNSSPADVLTSVPGVFAAHDGIWASSVNLRGFSEQRLLTLVDGYRMETASDLAGGYSMLDINEIERVEVVKGAASSVYGTGAMGGVVNYFTHHANYQPDPYIGGKVVQQYQTVNQLNGHHLSINSGAKRWNLHIGGSIRHAENAQTPEGELENSGFDDENISINGDVKIAQNQELKVDFQTFNAKKVGIPGGSSFASGATVQYKNANRNMLGVSYSICPSDTTGTWKSAEAWYFYQYIKRDVEVTSSSTVSLNPIGQHTIHGGGLRSNWLWNEKHSFEAGIDAWQRGISSIREKTVVKSGITTIYGEVPLPEAKFNSAGIFAQQNFKFNSKLNLTLGTRFDLIRIDNEDATTPLYTISNGVRNNNPGGQKTLFESETNYNQSFSAHAGLSWHPTVNQTVSVSFARSFRSPSLEERFKYIDLGTTKHIGNPALEPEKGWFADAGYQFNINMLTFEAHTFVNSINNYISEQVSTTSISTYIAENVAHAILGGFDVSTSLRPFKNLELNATTSFVRGIETTQDENLPSIPPLRATGSITYSFPKIATIEVGALLSDNQYKVAPGEKTTSGYATYNASIHSDLYNLHYFRLRLNAGVENIFDRAYRNHLTTNRGLIYWEPGRNFFINTIISW